jgi:ribose transport system permease protein
VIAGLVSPRIVRAALPALSLAALMIAIFWLQPRAASYMGLNLMLGLAIPIALATIAQMFILTVNDLDLSIGAYVGFCACIAGTLLVDAPLYGFLALAGGILAYAVLGALIHLRNLPSIVVTLGMSFVWLGTAVLILPRPGGSSPEWVRWLMTLRPHYVPFPIIAAIAIAAIVHLGLMRTSYGAVLRGAGGNPRAMDSRGECFGSGAPSSSGS